MINMRRNGDSSFPISSGDQLDIYELYTILKRRGRLEAERLSADLAISQKIRRLTKQLDAEQRIANRSTRHPEDHGIR